jgi:hypothetical protein
MPGPQPRLHLPFADWPETDKIMWLSELDDDDPFSDGIAARLATRTLHKYWMGWRRFLGFLTINEPEALEIAPPERLTTERVRRFAKHLAETNTPHSVAIQMESLYGAARTMMPTRDWAWLRNIKTRPYSAAPRRSSTRPVITSVQLMDLGVELMEESKIDGHKPFSLDDAVRYRDGLMIALRPTFRCDTRISPPSKSGAMLSRKTVSGPSSSHQKKPRREHTLTSRFPGIFSSSFRRTSLMCGRGCCVAQDARLFG